MKAIKNGRRALLCIGVLVAFSLPAQAALISFSNNWNLSDSISWNGNAGSRSENFYAATTLGFSLFDGSIGVLNSVTFSFSNMSITSSARSNYDDTDWFSETAGDLQLSSPRMYLNNSFTGFRNFFAANRRDTCYDESLSGGSSCTTTLVNRTQNIGGANIVQADESLLASLTGTGLQSMSVFLSGNLYSDETDGDDGYVDYLTGSLSGRGMFTVTYDYTEHEEASVPEPPTLALLFLGILGLLAVKKRQAQ